MIILIAVALTSLAALIIYGVASVNSGNILGGESANLNSSRESPERTPVPRPVATTGVEHFNPLTGEPMDMGLTRARPLAVVLNNLAEALPLNGVSDADIIYEYPVEGGLTRLLALFQDVYDIEKIGCIRSARLYTVQLAKSYDAILVAAGRSPQAQTEVRELGVPFLNEVEGPLREVFFRDRNRIPGRRVESLHSVVITGDRIMQWLPEYNFDLEHDDDFHQGLVFNDDDAAPQNGFSAIEVTSRFSAAKSTKFIYDSNENAYYVHQFNRDFVDANDNSRPNFANVLILRMPVSNIRGDNSGRLNIETTGRGTGYFINGGKYIEINWIRSDKSAPFIYTLEDGTTLKLGVGKTYICIVSTNADISFN
jgi:hypothetical protein